MSWKLNWCEVWEKQVGEDKNRQCNLNKKLKKMIGQAIRGISNKAQSKHHQQKNATVTSLIRTGDNIYNSKLNLKNRT